MPGKLTATFVSKTKKPGKYHDGGGTGLFLLVRPTGGRFWIQRITIRGERREIGLGSPPVVTLSDARDTAIENKRKVRDGLDPIAEKRREKGVLTFEEAARKAHAEFAPSLSNEKDRAAYIKSLETYAFPKLGRIALPDVTSADIRQVILAARVRAPEVARKVSYRISSVFKWGIAEGKCENNPATPDALALPRLNRSPQHRKALPFNEVATCIEAIRESRALTSTKLALEFLILTATRSGETRKAVWEEFEFQDSGRVVWEIPAERMKMKDPHRIPLSPRAIEVLGQARALGSGSGLVFPGMKRGRPLSDMTLSKLVKDLGFNADVHGFRASFRTWTQDETEFPFDLAEAALAHSVGGMTVQAYARGEMFERRSRMMDAWDRYLNGERDNVIAFSGGVAQ